MKHPKSDKPAAVVATAFESISSTTTAMYVTKRNGKHEAVHLEKVHNRIAKLCDRLDPTRVDPVIVAIKVVSGLVKGISTAELDNLAAETCAAMQTQSPDYSRLAARIFVSNLHKQTSASFSEVTGMLYHHVHPLDGEKMPLVSEKYYRHVMANKDALDKMVDYKRDNRLSYFGLKTLEKAYLLKNNNVVIERPQHLFMRVAVALHGSFLVRVKETYDALSQKYFIQATPTLFNAGTPRAGLSSCFLLAATPETDSIEGIYSLLSEAAVISKHSGGIGLAAHDIRAKGSLIRSTNGRSEGLVPMLRVFNASVEYVTQGTKRPGAMAVYLAIWHAEIFEFIKLKENGGIDEQRARNLFYGMWIPDLFMHCVERDEEWALFCPNEAPGLAHVYGEAFNALYAQYVREKRYRKLVPARNLMFHIIESQMKTGGPYMLYSDQVNEKNTQKHVGTVLSSNLCTEIVEYADSRESAVCNLASLGLPTYIVYSSADGRPQFDYKALYEKTKIVTRNLDRVIDITHYPVEKTRASNLRHRPLGIGVSGLADVFMLMRVPFDSPEARELNKRIFETMYYAAIETSCELAQECGPYASYPGSGWSRGEFQWHYWPNVTHSGMYDWDALVQKVVRYGMRNSYLTCCMPTASTSQILGYTEAIEPMNSNIYKRQTLSGEFMVVNQYLVNDLIRLDLWSDTLREKIIKERGSIQKITAIPAELRAIYKTAWDISQKAVIDLAADRAPYIDQSQSLNIFMAEPTYEKLMSMHMYGFKKGLKTGMYYLKMKAAAAPIAITTKVDLPPTQEHTSVKTVSTVEPEEPVVCLRTDGTCFSCSA